MTNLRRHFGFVFVFLLVCGFSVGAQAQRILVQSTTSTQNSGFYDYILPLFQADTGLSVNVVAVGTGQAIRNAMNGDADVLLVHAKAAEQAFVEAGYGVERFDLMYNDFVLIGPQSAVADYEGFDGIGLVLADIYRVGGQVFVSRGDDSGTHKAEMRMWALNDEMPEFDPSWYRETGAGMGATIRAAIEMQGFTLTDRATWIAFGDKQNFAIVYQGDPAMFNQYGIIAVNPERFDHVNAAGAQMFIDWLLSEKGQALIAAYQVDGQQLFFPNAG